MAYILDTLTTIAGCFYFLFLGLYVLFMDFILPVALILLGILFSAFGSFSDTLVYAGIACFGFSLVFQLVTLPVEFNASRRALRAIESGELLTSEERRGARKTLTAAAMTYVAATAVSLAQLLRLIMLFGGRRRDD